MEIKLAMHQMLYAQPPASVCCSSLSVWLTHRTHRSLNNRVFESISLVHLDTMMLSDLKSDLGLLLIVAGISTVVFFGSMFLWLLITRNRLGCIPVAALHMVFSVYAWVRLLKVKWCCVGSFGATEILPGLWVGNLEDAHNLDALRAIGVNRVCAVMFGIDPSFPEHFRYHMVSILDIESEDLLPHIAPAVQFIEDALNKREVVLVHCNQGKSRSGSIAVATIMRRQHMNFMDALLFAKQRRPSINPNAGFTRALLDYEHSVITSLGTTATPAAPSTPTRKKPKPSLATTDENEPLLEDQRPDDHQIHVEVDSKPIVIDMTPAYTPESTTTTTATTTTTSAPATSYSTPATSTTTSATTSHWTPPATSTYSSTSSTSHWTPPATSTYSSTSSTSHWTPPETSTYSSTSSTSHWTPQATSTYSSTSSTSHWTPPATTSTYSPVEQPSQDYASND